MNEVKVKLRWKKAQRCCFFQNENESSDKNVGKSRELQNIGQAIKNILTDL